MFRNRLVHVIARRALLGLLNTATFLLMASAVLFGDEMLVPLHGVMEAAPAAVLDTISSALFFWS
ncbi:MAG: hypothetical protein OXD31_16995 [Chloroflexi bacterium]|nr:hypothetical protein [Chloroflexota bacterium]